MAPTLPETDAAIIVALGGNLAGDFPTREALLEAALEEMEARGVHVLARSRWWRSAAWPDPAQPEYRNGVALVETALGPEALMATLLSVETAFRRERGARNAPRTLDLDLIAHGRTVISTPQLTLPHPRAHERRFVMGPLAQIAPGWRHPVSGRTAADLAVGARVGTDAQPQGGPS
jgi:2-amino-4-hydroxy-6-hydroxymethyldihydropteridine diphosphokinase